MRRPCREAQPPGCDASGWLTEAGGRDYLATSRWLATVPGACIAAVVLAFDLFGDWLRDVLDPQMVAGDG